MSKTKYIYIDDEKDSSTEAIRDGLNDTGVIEVDYWQVKDFNNQVIFFERELRSYDGIILDLRLDENLGAGVRYTAPSLAQELRTKSTANLGIPDLPIVLCSTDEKIKAIYKHEQTSHDLFDYKFLKSASPDWKKIAKRLHALSEGYKLINKRNFDLNTVFGRDISELDSRIFGNYVDTGSKFPSHGFAQYILTELIRWPGPLIGFELLAARLGIDIKKSDDWYKLLDEHLLPIKYNGVFSSGWSRWWVDLLTNWFKNLSGKRLSSLNAENRVSILREKCELEKLVVAEPLPKSASTNYSTVCEYFRAPLDPLEGFKVFGRKEPKPWQDHHYLSIEAVLERKGINEGLKIHPSEMERVEIIKKSLKKSQ
ncbi:MAG: hypothetical protein H6620_12560 [Halobacteriovoraceae bacterium]|nr:hypothetical protein [Halobacteriovoraceae bacterium]